MNLRISALHIVLAREQREAIERRIRFACGRFAPRIREISVIVEDSNGPRGGIDKVVRLVAKLSSGGSLHVSDVDAVLQAGVDRAADRLARSIQRELQRGQAEKRERGRRIQTSVEGGVA